MPRTSPPRTDLHLLVETYAASLIRAVELATTDRIRAAVTAALGAAPKRGRGRPPKNPFLIPALLGASRKPGGKQLCPVPGCTHAAAPVFGMVCAAHKDVPRAEIKKFRERRRLERAGASDAGPARARPSAPDTGAKRAPKKRAGKRAAA
jgi:hypothetical protein